MPNFRLRLTRWEQIETVVEFEAANDDEYQAKLEEEARNSEWETTGHYTDIETDPA